MYSMFLMSFAPVFMEAIIRSSLNRYQLNALYFSVIALDTEDVGVKTN